MGVEVEVEVSRGLYRVGLRRRAVAPSFCRGCPPLIGPSRPCRGSPPPDPARYGKMGGNGGNPVWSQGTGPATKSGD